MKKYAILYEALTAREVKKYAILYEALTAREVKKYAILYEALTVGKLGKLVLYPTCVCWRQYWLNEIKRWQMKLWEIGHQLSKFNAAQILRLHQPCICGGVWFLLWYYYSTSHMQWNDFYRSI